MSTDTVAADRRAALEGERASLRAELAELGYGTPEGLAYDANFADTSQVTAERGETETLVNRLMESLKRVERALAKLDDGSYGQCERCGEPIAPARLEAMPEAELCIRCAARR